MEYITIKVTSIHNDHILGENCLETGFRLFTLVEDIYNLNERYRVYIYESTRLDNNNNITVTRYAFLNRYVQELFKFLVSIKGIGVKGAASIIFSCGGSRNLTEILYREDAKRILSLNKKYASLILEAIKTPKNKEIIDFLYSKISPSSIRTEALWVLSQMNYEKDKCVDILTKLHNKLISQGYSGGIEDLKVEEVVRECLALLFSSK